MAQNRHIQRPMGHNREPRNNPAHLWSINLLEGRNIQGRKYCLLSSGAGKTEQLHVKDKIRTFSPTIYKNKLELY